MKAFLKRLIIFFIPLAIVFFIPWFTLVKSGETLPAGKIFLKQYSQNSLAGLAFSYPIKSYKLEGIKKISPEILIAGSSRVMQLRSFFFNNKSKVYNAGGFVSQITDAKCLLDNLPAGYCPKVLIIGLDQYFFNASFDTVDTTLPCNIKEEPAALYSLLMYNFKGIYIDYFKRRILPGKLLTGNGVGLSALMDNEGFRTDGSYRYGKLLTNPAGDEDYGFKDTYKHIANGTGRFEYGTGVNDKALKALEGFLNRCAKNKIHVIAFLPPYAHVISDTLQKLGEKYLYMQKLPGALQPIFAKYKFTFADYTNIDSLHAGADEFIDGFHVSEKAMLRVLIDLQLKDSVLQTYCDTAQMQKMLDNAKSARSVIGD